MRWYITAAITSTKTIKILSNIHSIEAAQCFSLNLNLQAPSPLAGLFVCPGRGRAGGYPAPAWTGPRPARVESVGRKYLRPKIPKVQGFAVTLLSEHRLLVFSGEITMAKVNLSEMSVETLMDLRKRVDQMLFERRAEIKKQLERMGAIAVVVRGGGSVLKGKKVPPKYRGPSGETWAGRGARPRWLVAAIKGGKKLDDFLIDKSARKGRRKRRSKR